MASSSSLPVDDIAKAVSGAVSSILSKLQNRTQEEADTKQLQAVSDTSSADEFQLMAPSQKRRRKVTKQKPKNTSILPSKFLAKRNAVMKGPRSKAKERVFTYDRDIICLPKSHGKSSNIPIPRSRSQLAKNGLIGKIRLTSDMTQDDIFDEIRSVFRGPMDGSSTFLFDILQPAGGHSKCLTIPALSDSFKWTASAIVSKNAKVPLYILAKEPLNKVPSSDDDSDSSDMNRSDDDLPFVDLTKSSSVESTIESESATVNPSCAKPPSAKLAPAKPPPARTTPARTVPTPTEYDSNEYGTSSSYVYENLIDYDWQYSPTPPPVSPATPHLFGSDLSFTDLLQIHRRDILPYSKEDRVRITVRRKFILQDTLHKLRNGLDLTQHLRVVFIGEPAVDDGGPLREFLYRLTVAVSHSDMLFCGAFNSRVPRHNLVELEKNTYFHIGAIIALSLVHGGPGPQFFSPAVADYIVYGVQNVKANIMDVPEQEIRDKIQKIADASSVSQLQELLNTEDFDFRYDLGISKPAHEVRLDDRETIVSSIALHYGVLIVKAELDQILCGLSSTLNALTLIRNNPVVMRPLFVYQKRPPPTADTLFDMFQAKFSEPGSNVREVEEDTMMKWSDFLQIIEGAKGSVVINSTTFNFSLGEIMQFTTGMPYEPPLGFIPQPSVAFTSSSPFPIANTCGNIIHLPTMHTSQDQFGWHICFGIQNSAGFGKV